MSKLYQKEISTDIRNPEFYSSTMVLFQRDTSKIDNVNQFFLSIIRDVEKEQLSKPELTERLKTEYDNKIIIEFVSDFLSKNDSLKKDNKMSLLETFKNDFFTKEDLFNKYFKDNISLTDLEEMFDEFFPEDELLKIRNKDDLSTFLIEKSSEFRDTYNEKYAFNSGRDRFSLDKSNKELVSRFLQINEVIKNIGVSESVYTKDFDLLLAAVSKEIITDYSMNIHDISGMNLLEQIHEISENTKYAAQVMDDVKKGFESQYTSPIKNETYNHIKTNKLNCDNFSPLAGKTDETRGNDFQHRLDKGLKKIDPELQQTRKRRVGKIFSREKIEKSQKNAGSEFKSDVKKLIGNILKLKNHEISNENGSFFLPMPNDKRYKLGEWSDISSHRNLFAINFSEKKDRFTFTTDLLKSMFIVANNDEKEMQKYLKTDAKDVKILVDLLYSKHPKVSNEFLQKQILDMVNYSLHFLQKEQEHINGIKVNPFKDLKMDQVKPKFDDFNLLNDFIENLVSMNKVLNPANFVNNNNGDTIKIDIKKYYNEPEINDLIDKMPIKLTDLSLFNELSDETIKAFADINTSYFDKEKAKSIQMDMEQGR